MEKSSLEYYYFLNYTGIVTIDFGECIFNPVIRRFSVHFSYALKILLKLLTKLCH